MEYTNEFLCRMISAYTPCNVFNTSTEMIYSGIVVNFFTEMIYSNEKGIVTPIHPHRIKPILTPSSAMKGEHLDEIAKIFGGKYSKLDDGFLQVINDDGFVVAWHILTQSLPIRLIDYLRSKNYDMGFQHIPSLIEAGLALLTVKS